jgi:hypothetical protein
MPVRPYQFDMAAVALHANTLVALPTGLGKTFVAAVVMLNYYRWFPEVGGWGGGGAGLLGGTGFCWPRGCAL